MLGGSKMTTFTATLIMESKGLAPTVRSMYVPRNASKLYEVNNKQHSLRCKSEAAPTNLIVGDNDSFYDNV